MKSASENPQSKTKRQYHHKRTVRSESDLQAFRLILSLIECLKKSSGVGPVLAEDLSEVIRS
jgi:hypothetical protein